MGIIIIGIIGICLVILVVCIGMLVLQRRSRGDASVYDVFRMDGDDLVLLSGLPETFLRFEIDQIELTCQRVRHGYVGVLHVIKTDGQQSRPFQFDYSSYKHKLVPVSTYGQIVQTADDLAQRLQARGFRCAMQMTR